ncbi:MAG: prolyl oligopeptidase family serine peptidase [Pirellulaceae bacterium]|nr:prolyl oligopeptidase family serine peptidase [Pirellulaceae bacterium]
MSQPYSGQAPNQPPPYRHYGAPPQRPSSNLTWLWVLLGVFGSGALLILLACGGIIYSFFQALKPLPEGPTAREPFQVASIPAAPMPELGDGEPLEELPGAKVYEVLWGPEQDSVPSKPGIGGKMYVLLPPGDHAPGSIPCLLAAPAGTNLMTGANTGPYFEPHIPYLEAGFAIMDYEFDGSPKYATNENEATRAFIEAQAGLVNSRNVIDFIQQKMPMVNSKQIFAIGHSSGGSHVLLLGEHDTRLAGVVAYAACCDIPNRIPAFLAKMLSHSEKRIGDFLIQSSPNTHAARMNCPVLLCHAKDDSNVPVSDSEEMHKLLQAAGKQSELHLTEDGDHYSEMLDQCIPVAIEWMKKRMNETK